MIDRFRRDSTRDLPRRRFTRLNSANFECDLTPESRQRSSSWMTDFHPIELPPLAQKHTEILYIYIYIYFKIYFRKYALLSCSYIIALSRSFFLFFGSDVLNLFLCSTGSCQRCLHSAILSPIPAHSASREKPRP